MTQAQNIPVTIIGGYLGSGKTTLINNLLRHADGKKLAILVNEFGELPIDADLIEAEEGDVISLSGGCVCCSYGNDLTSAVMDVAQMQPTPDHIVLEASGVALPGAIASSLSLLNNCSLDGIVVLADAETVKSKSTDKYMSDTIMRQLTDADIVLLNKIDLVASEDLHATREWLNGCSKNASIIETKHSTAPISVVLQDFERQSQPLDSGAPQHVDQFHTYKLAMEESVDPKHFAEELIANTPGIVRAKGFVRDMSGDLKTVQVVGKRFAITEAPDEVECGVVVITVRGDGAFIGKN